LLPLGHFGFRLQLQQAGNVNHFAQDQTQAHGAGRNVRLGPGVGETARQQREIKVLLGIGLKLAELTKVGLIHW
jgi:hypothetical protein